MEKQIWLTPQVTEIEVKETEELCYNKTGCGTDQFTTGTGLRGDLIEIPCS